MSALGVNVKRRRKALILPMPDDSFKPFGEHDTERLRELIARGHYSGCADGAPTSPRVSGVD